MNVFIIQVPLGDWPTLGRGRARGTEIPCRRMRSGSYVKAMGDLEDSEDSEGSPKPSPKSAARRHSYLKATQHSLSEQQQPPPPSRKWVPQHRESYSSGWNYDLDYHAHCFTIGVFVLFYFIFIKIEYRHWGGIYSCVGRNIFLISPKIVSRWQYLVTNNCLDVQRNKLIGSIHWSRDVG